MRFAKKYKVYLTPGLGNQIFQYRHALLLRDLGCDVELVAVRKYILRHEFIFGEVFDEPIRIIEFSLFYLVWQYIHLICVKFILKFPVTTLNRAPFRNIKISRHHFGYWQDTLTIQVNEKIVRKNKIFKSINRVKNVVSVHLRLGDYAKSIHCDHYNFIYDQVVNITNKSQKHIKIVTNSPDDDRTRKLIDYCNDKFLTVQLKSTTVINDILTLSESNEVILSNSTMSIFAGVLAKSANDAKCYHPSFMYEDGSGPMYGT